MEKLRTRMVKSLVKKQMVAGLEQSPELVASHLVFRKWHSRQRWEHWCRVLFYLLSEQRLFHPQPPNTGPLIRSNPKKEQTHVFCLQWLARFQTK